MSGSNDDKSMNCTPSHIQLAANVTYERLLPQKSKVKYELAYKKVVDWTLENQMKSITENNKQLLFTEVSLFCVLYLSKQFSISLCNLPIDF